jgi:hypothetical protein
VEPVSYIVTDDLYDKWGKNNVDDWATLDNAVSPTPAQRIASAIAWAEGYVESRFTGSRFAVPFSLGTTSTPIIKRWCAVLAGCWLYEARGWGRGEADEREDMQAERAQVDEDIELTLLGTRDFDAGLSFSGPSAPHE